jgi:hypothetical protein
MPRATARLNGIAWRRSTSPPPTCLLRYAGGVVRCGLDDRSCGLGYAIWREPFVERFE